MDAFNGRLIRSAAIGDKRPRREIYREVISRFGLESDTNLMLSTLAKGCDDDAIEIYLSDLRRRIRGD